MKFSRNSRRHREASATRITQFRGDPAKIGPFECAGFLQYFEDAGLERTGEYWGVESDNAVVFDVHYFYIDVTGVIAITMDIWSDCHADIL